MSYLIELGSQSSESKALPKKKWDYIRRSSPSISAIGKNSLLRLGFFLFSDCCRFLAYRPKFITLHNAYPGLSTEGYALYEVRLCKEQLHSQTQVPKEIRTLSIQFQQLPEYGYRGIASTHCPERCSENFSCYIFPLICEEALIGGHPNSRSRQRLQVDRQKLILSNWALIGQLEARVEFNSIELIQIN